MLALPDIRQHTDFGCGAAALEVAYRFAFEIPIPRWVRDLPDPARGVGPDTMELVVRKLFPHYLYGRLDLQTLRQLTRHTPVIALITIGPDIDHWVVASGVTRSRVHFHDPMCGVRSIPIDDWGVTWTDAAAGGAYARFGLAGWE